MKLKPCPFCGLEGTGITDLGYIVKCPMCGAYRTSAPGAAEDPACTASARWNRRPEEERLVRAALASRK